MKIFWQTSASSHCVFKMTSSMIMWCHICSFQPYMTYLHIITVIERLLCYPTTSGHCWKNNLADLMKTTLLIIRSLIASLSSWAQQSAPWGLNCHLSCSNETRLNHWATVPLLCRCHGISKQYFFFKNWCFKHF